MAQEVDKSFLGTGWSFPPTFRKAKSNVDLVSAEKDIQQSLIILLGTVQGERVLRPDFGANTERLLFEPLDNALESYMKDLLGDAILFHEPRITLDDIRLESSPTEGIVEITVEFTIRATNSRSNIVFPFFVNEGSNI